MPVITLVPASVFSSSAWISPNNALADDGSYATEVMAAQVESDRLAVLLSANTSIPANAVITDIAFRIKARDLAASGDVWFEGVHLGIADDDSFLSDDTGTDVVTAAATYSRTNLFGLLTATGFVDAIRAGTLTYSVVFFNNAAILARTIGLDYMTVDVTYSASGGNIIRANNNGGIRDLNGGMAA